MKDEDHDDIQQRYLKHWQVAGPVFTRPYQSPQDFFFDHEMDLLCKKIKLALGTSDNLIVVTGPQGSGKSALCRYLYQTISIDRFECLLLPREPLDPAKENLSITANLCKYYFSFLYEGRDSQDVLREITLEKRPLILFFDNAETMDDTELDELSALMTKASGAIKAVLAGGQALDKTLLKHKRMSAFEPLQVPLPLFTLARTQSFLEFALVRSGLDRHLLDHRVYQDIHETSGGRLVKIVHQAERLLIDAYLAGNAPKTPEAPYVEEPAAPLLEEAPQSTAAISLQSLFYYPKSSG